MMDFSTGSLEFPDVAQINSHTQEIISNLLHVQPAEFVGAVRDVLRSLRSACDILTLRKSSLHSPRIRRVIANDSPANMRGRALREARSEKKPKLSTGAAGPVASLQSGLEANSAKKRHLSHISGNEMPYLLCIPDSLAEGNSTVGTSSRPPGGEGSALHRIRVRLES